MEYSRETFREAKEGVQLKQQPASVDLALFLHRVVDVDKALRCSPCTTIPFVLLGLKLCPWGLGLASHVFSSIQSHSLVLVGGENSDAGFSLTKVCHLETVLDWFSKF